MQLWNELNLSEKKKNKSEPLLMYAGLQIFVTVQHCRMLEFEYTATGGKTWVDQGKDGASNIHLDGTRLVSLIYPAVYWQMCWGYQITQDISRSCSMHGDVKHSYIMVGKPKGAGICRKFVCEYNIKIDLDML